jgi:hypothetical protein
VPGKSTMEARTFCRDQVEYRQYLQLRESKKNNRPHKDNILIMLQRPKKSWTKCCKYWRRMIFAKVEIKQHIN